MRRTIWRVLAPVAVLLAAACGPGMDERSGGDATRGEAAQVALDTPFDDRVSAPQGDHTDWKTFSVDGPTRAEVHVWWDDPGLAATVTVRDQFSAALGSLKHRPGERVERLGPLELEPGNYFIEVQASEGASVYTMEIRTSAGRSKAPLRPDF